MNTAKPVAMWAGPARRGGGLRGVDTLTEREGGELHGTRPLSVVLSNWHETMSLME